jgi:hypothetical protein
LILFFAEDFVLVAYGNIVTLTVAKLHLSCQTFSLSVLLCLELIVVDNSVPICPKLQESIPDYSDYSSGPSIPC